MDAIGKYKDSLTKEIGKEINEHKDAIFSLVASVGGCVDTYRNTREEELNRTVADMYSPARVTDAARFLPKLKCAPGFALDLSNGWI